MGFGPAGFKGTPHSLLELALEISKIIARIGSVGVINFNW